MKPNKVQQNYDTGSSNYAHQKIDNMQYHSRVEDSSAKIPACLNRQSSTLIYSSDGGDLGKNLCVLNFKRNILFNVIIIRHTWN